MAYGFKLCDSTGRAVAEIMLGHLDNTYRLANGRGVPVHMTIAWCPACRTFAEVEELVTPERIEQELARIRSGDSGTARAARHIADMLGPEFTMADDPDEPRRRRELEQEELDTWLAVQSWRQARRSRPRCLRCGSTQVHPPVPRGAPSVRHPETGQRLTIECVGHFSLASHDYFTPEGLRID